MTGETIERLIGESSETITGLRNHVEAVSAAGDALIAVLRGGGKILTAGNGGSAAEALHMSEEIVGRFRADRKSLASVALVSDSTAITCIANDYGFDEIFSRQIEGLGRAEDALVLFSTSGTAANLKRAADTARKRGMKVVCLLGRDGGALAGCGDHEIIIQSEATERIQEAHQVIVHILLEMIEEAFGEELQIES